MVRDARITLVVKQVLLLHPEPSTARQLANLSGNQVSRINMTSVLVVQHAIEFAVLENAMFAIPVKHVASRVARMWL